MLRVRGLRAGRSRGREGARRAANRGVMGTTRGNPAREEHESWDRVFEALAEPRAL